jgi:hypothetical protein
VRVADGAVNAGLGGANLRLVGAPDPESPDPVQVIIDDSSPDVPEFDDKGQVVRIDHDDGSVTVSLDGKPIDKAANDAPLEWYSNLAEKIDASALVQITEDLLRGIDEDLESRKEWIESRAEGMKLLGLKIEIPNTQGASDGAPVEGMSKVRHPLLLEAVLNFQANSRGEFLPTDGPVKIRNDATGGGDDQSQPDPTQPPMLTLDKLANLLERTMNHYLTAVATEYYPDTDRMLFMAGFGGDGFKKVYKCPLRNRPVSESVDADDLIVNQSATDLANAARVTHRVMMRPSTVKRMQIIGAYRNVELGDALTPEADALKQEEQAQQGLRPESMRLPTDREREIYECYCELDVPGFEHEKDGKKTGLQIPYVVTIDRSSRVVLSLVRNFDESTEDLPRAKRKFVKFPFVPGIGFYGIGLLHILGNTANAITAGWRLMLDNGMFANFPGFLISKGGTRQNTNIMRVPPGGGAQIDTQGMPIGQSVMPLPYNTAQMPPLMALIQDMADTGRRVGGTAEVQVGEGRADVPVGTVLALIEQAIKPMMAVHKRMHSAQAEEFQLLRDLIKEDPQSFIDACDHGCKPHWTSMKIADLIRALDNCDMVPQADPNTASSAQRITKVQGLMQLAQASPNLYDPIRVNSAALAAMGWPNPDEFFVPPAARAQPPPQLLQMQQEMQDKTKAADAKTAEAQARLMEAKAKGDDVQAKIDAGHYGKDPQGPEAAAPPPTDTPADLAAAHAKLMDAETRRMDANTKAFEAHNENQNRDQDRIAAEREAQMKERDSALDLAKSVIGAPTQGESGKQVGVSTVGAKTNKIIRDVDKGLKD